MALKQRGLRKKSIERIQKRNQDYETVIDPERSSSGLTPIGGTRKEDK